MDSNNVPDRPHENFVVPRGGPRETCVGMGRWRWRLFMFLARLELPEDVYWRLPLNATHILGDKRLEHREQAPRRYRNIRSRVTSWLEIR